MYATTDWGRPRPEPAPAITDHRRPSAAGLTALVVVTLVLVVAAHSAAGWPRLVLAVAACSWGVAALARSALGDGW